jgi:type IV pilus assembly protein PilV
MATITLDANGIRTGMRGLQRGFSMIEILVSLFILTTGLLGLVGLQAVAHKAELESYQRAQALVLLTDFIDRVNTNRKAATCYAITTNTTAGTPYLGTTGTNVYSTGSYSCSISATNAAASTRAQQDLEEFENVLKGASEKTSGGSNIGLMIGARACIGYDSTSQTYTVAIAWQGVSETFSPATWTTAPAVAKNCALNLYGNDRQRRVVWNKLMIASLT